MLSLCSSPRVLKQALRRCLEAWSRLAGEIDLDDVLVLSVLREAQPNAFALIQDSLHYLRGHPSGTTDEKADLAWRHSLDDLKVDESTRKAIEHIVKFAFGKDPTSKKPQGVWHNNHADYWERFLALPELEPAERDQPILKRMVSDGDDADDDSADALGG